MKQAAARAIESHAAVRRKAERLCEELDDLTGPTGVPRVTLSEEDSVVTSVAAVIATHSK